MGEAGRATQILWYEIMCYIWKVVGCSVSACERAHTCECVEGKSDRVWDLGMLLEKGKMWKALCAFYIVF